MTIELAFQIVVSAREPSIGVLVAATSDDDCGGAWSVGLHVNFFWWLPCIVPAGTSKRYHFGPLELCLYRSAH